MKKLNNLLSKRRGAAIVIAIFFSFCMLVLIGSMVFRQSNTASHNQLNLLDKQAFFAARSAMQHFLLKAKLFPTELYDAVELSQGKNPIFNFAEFPPEDESGNELYEEYSGHSGVYVRRDHSEVDGNGKPRYFYVKIPSKNCFLRVASYYNPDYRFVTRDLAQNSIDQKYTEPKELSDSYKAEKFLLYYIRDCQNYRIDNKKIQPALEMRKSSKITNINDFDIASQDGYPYTLQYSVVGVKVKAIQGMKKYGEEAIEIQVGGEAKNFQNKSSSQLQTRTEKITRKGSV